MVDLCLHLTNPTQKCNTHQGGGAARAVLTFEGASPSLHPSHPLQPDQQEASQTTMENMHSRTTVQEGPCPPQHISFKEKYQD